MPFIEELNALFIHIPKNAGKSVHRALLPPGVSLASGRRTLVGRAATYVARRSSPPVVRRRLLGTCDVTVAAQHLTLAEITLLGLLPEATLAGCLKFCVVRNPFDRVVSSLHNFRGRVAASAGLEEFGRGGELKDGREFERAVDAWLAIEPTDHGLRAHRRPQAEFVWTMDHAPKMDMVLRYESLDADFALLCRRLGAARPCLPRLGGAARSRPDWRDYYTDRSRRSVARAFEVDLDRFGYAFGADAPAAERQAVR